MGRREPVSNTQYHRAVSRKNHILRNDSLDTINAKSQLFRCTRYPILQHYDALNKYITPYHSVTMRYKNNMNDTNIRMKTVIAIGILMLNQT